MKKTEPKKIKRCPWVGEDELYLKYHDQEWGVPVHDDKTLFEMLILEGAQAGLSWMTILKRRENYRKAFDNFNIGKIAKYTDKDIERLLADSGIIRNRLKIKSAINNAARTLEIQKEYGSLDKFLWQFVDGKTIHNSWKSWKSIPVTTDQSDAMSKALKKAGFTFIGSTSCYAFMQSAGMVNDHAVDCFRYNEIKLNKYQAME
ncbi:MAG: DNA-3-methyladenine glycosylase I [Sedimentisphaeraceae bacterium JB056]